MGEALLTELRMWNDQHNAITAIHCDLSVSYKHVRLNVIRAKPGIEPGVRKLLANYQTGFGCTFRPTNS